MKDFRADVAFVLRDPERWQGETDGAGLAIVRMLVALSVLIEMLQVWFTDEVTDLVVEPQLHFKYTLFPWVGPPQGMMPFVFVWVLAMLALLVLLGWRTRWTAALMAAGYVYWFLIDAANYTDRAYLVCLLSILVAWLPTNRWASVDAYMGREPRTLVPAWCVEFMRTQVAIVYFFFALSLLNSDWLHGAPLIDWSESVLDQPFATMLAGRHGLLMAIAWLMPVLYLAAIPGLWWKRSRPFLLVVLAVFHLWDALTFRLTVAPWLLTGVNLIFCDPSRWRRWGDYVLRCVPRWALLQFGWKTLCRGGLLVDRCVSWFDDTPLIGEARSGTRPAIEPANNVSPTTFPASARYVVTAWLILQCWLPVRYVTVETQPDWTNLSTPFSWRGQHLDKQAELKMSVIQLSQELRWPLDPIDEFPVPLAIFYSEEELEKRGLSEGALKDLVAGPEETHEARFAALQIPTTEAEKIIANFHATVDLRLTRHQYEQMVQHPEFVRQYARHVARILTPLLDEKVQVHADLRLQLNDRPSQSLLTDDVEDDLLRFGSANELADHLPKLKTPLPPVSQRILTAQETVQLRRITLEQDFDIVLDKKQTKGEPAKLPVFSDEDERWYQEHFVKGK